MPQGIGAHATTRAPIDFEAAVNSRTAPRRAWPDKTGRKRAVSTPTNQKRTTHTLDSRGRAGAARDITPGGNTARSTEEP